MITFMREADGSFTRSGELAAAGDFFIEVLDPGSREWRDDYRARFSLRKAIDVIEIGIVKRQVRFTGYRIVPAPAKPLSETERARLAGLRARSNQNQEETTDMATKKAAKRAAKPNGEAKSQGEGRKPTLAPFIDGGFTITAEYKGKTFEAKVNADGTIEFDGETYTSPSSAGKAAIKKSVDGWTFWKKGGEPLDELRGKKSPLTKSAAA